MKSRKLVSNIAQARIDACPSRRSRTVISRAKLERPHHVKTRVYIVDDHVLIRYGLTKLISAEDDMEVCGQAENAAQGLQEIINLHPDLVIVDVALQRNSGLELIKGIRAQCPEVRILVISFHPESIYGIRALGAGAHGYVMKHDGFNKVVMAIRRLRDGGICVSDEVAERMLRRSVTPRLEGAASLFHFLSDPELEIVNLIGSGLTTREIAVKLHLSVKTVEMHRGCIRGKLNLRTAAQLVQGCVRWVDEHNRGQALSLKLGAA